jgi:cytochrome c peroxidase
MFAAFRARPAHRIVFSASFQSPRAQIRPSFRKFSTTPPPQAPQPQKSNTALYAGLGVAVVGGLAYYLYSGSDTASTTLKSAAQAVKAKAFTPKKEDYQKVVTAPFHWSSTPNPKSSIQVYNKIAVILDDAGDYDGVC